MPEEQEVKTDDKADKTAEAITLTPKQLSERLARAVPADYEDFKAKAAKFDAADEANKTELQKAIDRADAAEKNLTPAQEQVARLEVALEKGLTATQAKRLVGKTKEEFAADADELLTDLGAKAKAKPDVKKLKSGSAADGDGNTGKERAAAALRQLRGN